MRGDLPGSKEGVCARGAARRQKLTAQTAQYGDTRPQTGQPAGGGPVAAAAVILYPFTPVTDPGTAAMLLLQHVSYHVQMGFAKVVQYTQARPCLHRGTLTWAACRAATGGRVAPVQLLVLRAARGAQMSFLRAFLRDERLRVFIRAGQLELVLWDHLGECVGPPHMRCWQPVVYSHAILEAWGSGLHLLISDIDEYFVLPTNDTTFAAIFEGNCINGKPKARPAPAQPASARPASAPCAATPVPLAGMLAAEACGRTEAMMALHQCLLPFVPCRPAVHGTESVIGLWTCIPLSDST